MHSVKPRNPAAPSRDASPAGLDAALQGTVLGPDDASLGVLEGMVRAPLSLARSVAFVARQPIFDRERRLVGYELLYRSALGAADSGGGRDDAHMTGSTLVNGILGVGLEQLTGSKPAWVNFPRELLHSQVFELLDPRRCIIELLETIEPDPEAVAACEALRARGFTLALDDFTGGEQYDPLVRLVHVVKLRVLDVTRTQLADAVARLAPFGVRLLAEQVETRASFDSCLQLGFDYFQGFHFSRPEVVIHRELPVEMVHIGRLMSLVLDVSVPDIQIEEELRKDPGLSFKLLRMVNVAASGGRGIESLLHAVRLVGRSSLHRWLSLLLVSSVPQANDVDRELVLLTLERARFCELIASESGQAHTAAPAFLAGLLSSFDTTLGIPMDVLLRQISVSDDVRAALVGAPGPFTTYVRLTTAYARAEWDVVLELVTDADLLPKLSRLYAFAGRWARTVLVRT